MSTQEPTSPGSDPPHATTAPWTPDSWRAKPRAHVFEYPDGTALERELAKLRSLPPLVTSWEIERLRSELVGVEQGRRLLLQGGDCAETLDDCRSEPIAAKLKILLQMSLVLIHAGKKPVTRMGRFAGQYAKPRSSPTETRGGQTLTSYFGDLINRAEFSAAARTPDPALLVEGYQHAALTLNFIRALVDGGFADLHHPEYWDLSFFKHASLSPETRAEYQRMTATLGDGIRFMEALGERAIEDLSGVEFFASHEGLNLYYESAQTRLVPRRRDYYCLTTHMPWIGERTRAINGAHVEFFRGIRNPVGVKLGPGSTASDAVALSEALNPANEAGKLVFISRLGAGKVRDVLPGLLEGVRAAGRKASWVCDPMHANGSTTGGGIKTRSFDAIKSELEGAYEVHEAVGVPFGGVHFELTGEDVTECVGGGAGVTEADLTTNYASLCDPRLNYQQSLEMALLLARRMAGARGK